MKFKKMLETFEAAVDAYSWRGSQDPEDIPSIKKEYENAKKDLYINILVLQTALKDIKNTQGHVCDQFEICNHRACRSSHAAWEIADKALSGMTK
jgi:hypothetical protein